MTAPTVSIRRATVADAEAVSSLSGKVFPLGCPAETNQRDLADFIAKELTPERFREFLQDEAFSVLLAETETELAGYAMLVRGASHAQLDSPHQSELRKFYVDARYHGRGVSDVLMREVMASVDPSGESLWLSVFSGNQRAISFYQRWGFQIAGTQYFLVGSDNQKDYLMLREPKLSAKDAIE